MAGRDKGKILQSHNFHQPDPFGMELLRNLIVHLLLYYLKKMRWASAFIGPGSYVPITFTDLNLESFLIS